MPAENGFSLTNRMEAFHRACVDAVAAAAGVTADSVSKDFNKTDIYLTVRDGDASMLLQAQLKSTARLTEDGNNILYDLDIATFNKLQNPRLSNTPRILIVMELPDLYDNWSHCDHERVLLRRRVFWTHLYQELPTTNAATRRITISRDRLLTAQSLVSALKSTSEAFEAARKVATNA